MPTAIKNTGRLREPRSYAGNVVRAFIASQDDAWALDTEDTQGLKDPYRTYYNIARYHGVCLIQRGGHLFLVKKHELTRESWERDQVHPPASDNLSLGQIKNQIHVQHMDSNTHYRADASSQFQAHFEAPSFTTE
jgi:hypothetical protein